MLTETAEIDISWLPMPPYIHNHGNYIASLANLCRWLGGQAEALGVEIYSGMAASEVVYGEDGAVRGVVAGVFGIGKDGQPKADYQPGVELLGKYVLLAEGARGSLSKQIQARFGLTQGREPQKYGIGLKELWQVAPEKFRPGLVQHSFGWPLDNRTGGGSFIYHFGDRYVAIGPSCISTTPTPGSHRSRSSRSSSGIHKSGRCWKAQRGSPMARERSPRAATSRCPSWPSPAGR